MCKFMSCISDGNGEVKFFTIQNIVEIMASGNHKSYSWNSHTSMCQFYGIKSTEEDKWNKWEYNPETKELVVDSLVTTDDRKSVLHYLDKYFYGKDIVYLRNFYNSNSGDSNSGNSNSGDSNSGNWNSGDSNSGNSNSGNRNSGNRNSGDWNSGDSNSGNRNSGNRNSGNRNSGDSNSGNSNSGDWNSGGGVLNSLCTKRIYMLFDKPCTKEQWEESLNLPYSWFELTVWVSGGDMTEEEKKNHSHWKVTGGYLKTIDYKEAWKKCPKEFIDKVKKLKNFSKSKFKKISGLDV